MKCDIVNYIRDIKSDVIADGGIVPKMALFGDNSSWVSKNWVFVETAPGGNRVVCLDKKILNTSDPNKIAAAKIIIGHEICHASFNGMYAGSIKYSKKKSLDDNILDLAIHMLIESGCDQYGHSLYFSNVGVITPDILNELIDAHNSYGECSIPGTLKSGYLTGASRETLVDCTGGKALVSALLTKYCDLWEKNIGGRIDRVRLFDSVRSHSKRAVLDKFLEFDI